MRLTWRKQPSEKGLAAVGQGPRGVDLRQNGERVMCVRPYTQGKYTIHGWYFYGSGYNSLQFAEPYETMEIAKEKAKKYFLQKQINQTVAKL